MRVYQGTLEQGHAPSSTPARSKRTRSAAWCACTPTRWRTSRRPAPATSSRSSASTAPRATPSPTARVNVAMTLDARAGAGDLALDQARRTARPQDNMSKALGALHQGGSDLPRRRRPRERRDHHLRHGRAAPRRLRRAHEARVQRRGRDRRAAGRLPRDDHPARRLQLHPQEADRRLGPVRPRSAATSSRRSRSGLRVRQRGRGRHHPDGVHLRRSRRASASMLAEGPPDRLPGHRRARRAQRRHRPTRSTRRTSPSRRPARGAFREVYPKAKPIVLEPIMKRRGRGPDRVPGRQCLTTILCSAAGSIIGTTEEDGFCRVEAEVPLAEMFGYATDAALGDPGQGRVHDGVLPVPARARIHSRRAGRKGRQEEGELRSFRNDPERSERT